MVEDPYVYPGTGVLRNNLEIRDPQELAEAEADIVRAVLATLADEPLAGSYDLAQRQLQAHQFLAGL
jgi:fido (protein-threonine AMPylation protein)